LQININNKLDDLIMSLFKNKKKKFMKAVVVVAHAMRRKWKPISQLKTRVHISKY